MISENHNSLSQSNSKIDIQLHDVPFYSYHGVMGEEKKLGNQFRVSLSVTIPYTEKMEEDELSSTVSYAELYDIVREEMAEPRNLLEKVAIMISKKIRQRFPQIEKGVVKIEKLHPPIPGMIGSASVSFNF